MNPLEVSGGLKEERIRLVAECNQCDSITEYDGGGTRVSESLEHCSQHANKRGDDP